MIEYSPPLTEILGQKNLEFRHNFGERVRALKVSFTLRSHQSLTSDCFNLLNNPRISGVVKLIKTAQ